MKVSNPKPFLFVDSPNVGSIGHAYVHSPDRLDVTSAAAFAASHSMRNPSAAEAIALGTGRHVSQQDTNRGAKEWLICAGAIPETQEGCEAVEHVLTEILEKRVEVEWLQWLQTARQSSGLLHTAPEMTDMETAFFSRPEIQEIRWRSIVAAQAPDSPDPGDTSHGGHKALGIIIVGVCLLVMGAAILTFNACNSTNENDPSNGETEKKGVAWKLEGEAWKRVLLATGGSHILFSMEASEGRPRPKDCEQWAGILLDEFDVSQRFDQPRPDQVAIFEKLIGKAPGVLKGGVRGESHASFWWHPYQNRLDEFSDEMREAASTIQVLVNDMGGESHRFRIDRALALLGEFCREMPSHEFSETFEQKLADRKPAAVDYLVVTPMDVKRFNLLKDCLGSREFGAVLAPGGRGQSLDEWEAIILALQNANWRGNKGKETEQRLIDGLQKNLLSETDG